MKDLKTLLFDKHLKDNLRTSALYINHVIDGLAGC